MVQGVFHFPRDSGNSGWDINGTRVFGAFHGKTPGINGTSEKLALYDPFSNSSLQGW